MGEKETQKFENDISSWIEEFENHVPAISAAQLMEQPIEPT